MQLQVYQTWNTYIIYIYIYIYIRLESWFCMPSLLLVGTCKSHIAFHNNHSVFVKAVFLNIESPKQNIQTKSFFFQSLSRLGPQRVIFVRCCFNVASLLLHLLHSYSHSVQYWPKRNSEVAQTQVSVNQA